MNSYPEPRRDQDGGFTIVEMAIATALGLIIMLASLGAVIEGQRSLTTVMNRTSDINAAQSVLTRIATGVRGASAASIITSGSQSQLWLQASGTCTEWVFTGAPTNALELQTGTSHLSMSTPPAVEISGVTSGSFSGFTNYPGLIDVTLSVQAKTSSSANGYQAATAPIKLETQVDDPNMSGAVGSGYPGSC